MLDNNTYKTIREGNTSLIKDRGSKFLGYSFPISSKAQFKNHYNLVKEQHPQASHYCFAYRLGFDNNDYRLNDDGEPSGSAGRPILGQIDSFELTNILIIVVRYFGGTLLGIPGLISAYKNTAFEALSKCEVIEEFICYKAQINTDYAMYNSVLYHLKNNQVKILKQDLQLFCTLWVNIPISYWDICISTLSTVKGLEIIKIEE